MEVYKTKITAWSPGIKYTHWCSSPSRWLFFSLSNSKSSASVHINGDFLYFSRQPQKIRQFKALWKAVQSLCSCHMSVWHRLLLVSTTTASSHSLTQDARKPLFCLLNWPLHVFFYSFGNKGRCWGAAASEELITCTSAVKKPTLLVGLGQNVTPRVRCQSWMSHPECYARLPKGHFCPHWHWLLALDVNVLQSHPLWTYFLEDDHGFISRRQRLNRDTERRQMGRESEQEGWSEWSVCWDDILTTERRKREEEPWPSLGKGLLVVRRWRRSEGTCVYERRNGKYVGWTLVVSSVIHMIQYGCSLLRFKTLFFPTFSNAAVNLRAERNVKHASD